MADKNYSTEQPNIVIILADDMGFSDIGCYGSEIETPNLDSLAADGARFSQMYNCARCCPSRASLLTGLYPHQAGVGHMVNDTGIPGYRGRLNDRCVTIAEALSSNGYRTFMSGKWHVGGGYQYNRPETWRIGDDAHPTPIQRGFDEHYGTVAGGGSYYDPPTLARNDRLIRPESDDYYYTDAISEEACRMIENSQGAPFFLHVTYTAPHWPLHAWDEDIAKFEGRYNMGWDALRGARHEELKSLGIVERNWPISAHDEKAPPWNETENRDWEALRMSVYAAQVHCMDRGIGRILAKLRSLRLEENTLVIFLSDNGGCAEFLAEDGQPGYPERFDIPTRDGRPMRIGNTPQINPGPADTFQSYDLPWANASNSPFRLFKHWVHEGGIATPLIARWPGVTNPDSICHSPAHVIDLMPTCLEAAGASYPNEYNGRPITSHEGESLVKAMRGEAWERRRPIFWEHEGNRAVRDGEWKLVSKHPDDWELYNMSADRTETVDLADKNRAKVNELTAFYNEWAARCGVQSWPLKRR